MRASLPPSLRSVEVEGPALHPGPSVTFAPGTPAIDDASSSTRARRIEPQYVADASCRARAAVGKEHVVEEAAAQGPAHLQQPRRPRWWQNAAVKAVRTQIKTQLNWITPNLTWPKLKPVFRAALATWIVMVLLLIHPSIKTIGHSAFLMLVSSALQPADAPWASIVERELALLLLCTVAWAWSCIAIAIAHAVRTQKLPAGAATTEAILRGDFIEAGPSTVCAVFQAFGAAMYLWIKISFGPGPLFYGTVLSCLTLNIMLTQAPLYPHAHYLIGRQALVPLAIKAAITMVVGMLFLPKSNNSLFCERINAVLKPLKAALEVQVDLLARSPLEADFPFDAVQKQIVKGESGLAPLQMSSRLLKREVTVGHASGQDLKDLEIIVRKAFPAFDGMAQYFATVHVDVMRAQNPSRPPTPLPLAPNQGQVSRSTTPELPSSEGPAATSSEDTDGDDSELQTGRASSATEAPCISRDSHASAGHLNDLLHQVLHAHPRVARPRPRRLRKLHSSHSVARVRDRVGESVPVGTWEGLRYMAIDAHLHPASSNKYTELAMFKLGESATELIELNALALGALIRFFDLLNLNRVKDFFQRFYAPRSPMRRLKEWEQDLVQIADQLEDALTRFRDHKRLVVLEPLIASDGKFDPRLTPHRYTYQVFFYQFALLDLSKQVLRLIRKAQRTCIERKVARIWGPDTAYWRRFEAWIEVDDASDQEEHELKSSTYGAWQDGNYLFVGQSAARDPDALAPDTTLEWAGQRLFAILAYIFTSTRLFAWKAGLATALVSLPQFLRSSAEFCASNKALWSVFMMQLSLSRYRGDSLFAIWVRIIATAVGACFGGILWYVASGNGRGNVWGMGVTTAVGFPILFFIRAYHPAPQPLKSVLTVTTMLVLGFSWIGTHNPTPGTALTYGADILWRRMVNVFIGLGAAFVVSLLPPSHTLRRYMRHGHAACIAELTRLTCCVLSFGTVHPDPAAVPDDHPDRVQLNKSLLALRAKIRQLKSKGPNTMFEVSLRGKWPEQRYTELNAVLLDAAKRLMFSFNVLKVQSGPWARAQFKRLRLSDPQFVGDLFAVLHMSSTSLAVPMPMPQITPAPLFDRLFTLMNGFDVVSARSPNIDEEETLLAELNLPKHLDRATLENQDYFYYASGANAWSSFVWRLDRVALAVKELCGEAYVVPTQYKEHYTPHVSQFDLAHTHPADSASPMSRKDR